MGKKNKLIAQGGMFIDPADCGSTIMYKVVDDTHNIDMNINITDCNRMICWYFNADEAGIKKVENAIRVLEEAKRGLLRGIKIQTVYDAERQKKKEDKPKD
jgi:hypothetical protein